MSQYYSKDLRWICLGLHPSEVMEMVKDCEVWWLNLELQLRNSHDGKEGNEERDIFSFNLSMFSNVSFVSCIFTNYSFHLQASSLHKVLLVAES